ncbi:MAG: sulfite oxidase [Bryobacteraceae bacterium]|nr:sulfite oxidase [Bryobacteraceae bacterium]
MLTRRDWIRILGVAAGAPASAQELVFPGKRPMLVQNDFPEDLESPVEYFDTWLTPIDSFFVRQHLPRPKVDPGAWKLEISGMVANSVSLSLDELRKLPQYKVPATLECAGNGRGYFTPKIPGLQWKKGAIGNAEWRGPRVADILKKAGVKPQAQWGSCNGADAPVAKTPDFIRSIPMRKLMHEATLIALEMNGQPLPEIHGGPARLIVPGWDGASWVKWANQITVSDKPDAGFYFATAYRYPKHSVAPGGAPKPGDMEVLEGMAVKSFFVKPADTAKVGMSPVRLQGVGWAGEFRVARVEVSTDGGSSWRDARLSPENYNFAWRLWTLDWTPPRPGYYTLMSRATDSAGRVQPIEAPWNPSGYLWNSVDRIGVTVEG